jgi:acyl-CoA synthetase (AMP-forming)/AMP-acid ligase II
VLLHEILGLAAATCPDDEALIADGRRLTFRQLETRVRHMSNRLDELAVPGDRVAVVSDNLMDGVVALYAVPRRGASLAPANTRHTPEEIGELLDSTAPAVLLASPDQLDRLDGVIDGLQRKPQVLSLGGGHPAAEYDLTERLDEDADRGAHAGPDQAHHVAADARVCAWIINTSGTTGRAKGAMLTHASLAAAVLNTAIARPFADDDVYLFPFPLFHVAAYNVLHAHLRRRPVVLLAKFDADAAMEAMDSEGVTNCSLAPTMLAMLLDRAEKSPGALAGLRQISYGASPMPEALMRRVLEELPHCELAQGYGMTELSGNAVFLGPEGHRRAVTDQPELLGSAGRPGPLVAVRIEDEEGNALPTGGVGEILVRGDQVASGYWQDPVATAESRSGAWLRTGDVGRMDAGGNLHIVDRRKDIIITGGENVPSREVENVMCSHPLVSQVAVVGLPDDRWGEAVTAVVVAEPGAADRLDTAELVEWTRGRLAGFKRPKRVVVLDQLPVNASGKVDKQRLRAMAADAG